MIGKPDPKEWYRLQAAYWGVKWAGYAFNPVTTWYIPKMKECARLACHFAILADANAHIYVEGNDPALTVRNIVCHMDMLLTDEQKVAINWHPDQSVSLAVMRLISDLSKSNRKEG